jgi:hypothetical protein
MSSLVPVLSVEILSEFLQSLQKIPSSFEVILTISIRVRMRLWISK